LDPLERQGHYGGEGLGQERLRGARHPFEQHVPLAQQAHEHEIDDVLLPDDDAIDLGPQPFPNALEICGVHG
jgi:hypothetical protein